MKRLLFASAALLALCLLITLFASCSEKPGDETSPEAAEEPAPVEETNEPVDEIGISADFRDKACKVCKQCRLC